MAATVEGGGSLYPWAGVSLEAVFQSASFVRTADAAHQRLILGRNDRDFVSVGIADNPAHLAIEVGRVFGHVKVDFAVRARFDGKVSVLSVDHLEAAIAQAKRDPPFERLLLWSKGNGRTTKYFFDNGD